MHPSRLALLGSLLLFSLQAQTKEAFWPETKYDPAIPTMQKVLGYEPGDKITPHAGLMKYAEALAAAAPNRTRLVEYAKSWEGRKLVYMAVGSETNIRRLKEIQAGMKKLSDPRVTPEAEAKRLIGSLPALVWIAAGVHGDEISSPEAALMAGYHLLAARGDKLVDSIMANTVVFIVPTQNPDGRDRFVSGFEQSYGIEPDPNPAALEHSQPFPGKGPAGMVPAGLRGSARDGVRHHLFLCAGSGAVQPESRQGPERRPRLVRQEQREVV
jgi:hypothetical protein